MTGGALPLIFDLDGTLVHTLPDIAATLGRVFATQGLPVPSEPAIRRMIGDGARTLIARALAAAGEEPSRERVDRLYRAFLADYEVHSCVLSAPFPHVREALAQLRAAGHRLGVCTNKPQRATEMLLRAFALDQFFDAVAGGDLLPWRKPDPRHLQAVLTALSQTSQPMAIMIGDSQYDLLAARGAGIPCILVRHGYGEEPVDALAADLVIDSFAQLIEAVGALSQRLAP